VLGAVKRMVDQDPRPSRFLITGSVRASLTADTWPGTGRVLTVPMYGLTVAESRGHPNKKPFLDVVADRGARALTNPADPLDLAGYLDIAFGQRLSRTTLASAKSQRRSVAAELR
jgi:hypothetical protein